MKRFLPHAISLVALAVLAGCNQTGSQVETKQVEQVQQSTVAAPIAKKVPHEMEIHGHKRVDNYYWMRDDNRKDPEILAHLEAENTYTKAQLSNTEQLQATLFEELKSRIQKTITLYRQKVVSTFTHLKFKVTMNILYTFVALTLKAQTNKSY